MKAKKRKSAAKPESAADVPPSAAPDRFARWGWGAALAGGIAGGLSFDPFALRALIPIAPALLFLAAHSSPTPRAAFLRGFAGGSLFHLLGISWLFTLHRFHGAAPLGIVVVALYMGLYPGLCAFASRKWFGAGGIGGRFSAYAALWIATEAIRTWGKLAMPFDQLGHAWAPWPRAIQWADVLGELGVSLQALLAAGALVGFLLASPFGARLAQERTGGLRFGGVCFALFLAMLGSSIFRAPGPSEPSPERTLVVAVVQPNVDQFDKMAVNMEPWGSARRARLIEESFLLHGELARRAASAEPAPDLIVMPESTFAQIEFGIDREARGRVELLASEIDVDLLFGADRIVVHANGEEYDPYNSAWYLRAGEALDDSLAQDKMRLVPFGEYIPYVGAIPGVRSFVGLGDFKAGREAKVIEGPKGTRLATTICFESTFSSRSRVLARKGAEFLAVATNDGWYGRSAGPRRHHDLSRLRAVETRRWIVRAANTGISSIVRPDGTLAATLPLGERGVLSAPIEPRTDVTFFARWGNLWLLLGCGATLLWVGFRARVSGAPAGAAPPV